MNFNLVKVYKSVNRKLDRLIDRYAIIICITIFLGIAILLWRF
jgi:hypothetical protein